MEADKHIPQMKKNRTNTQTTQYFSTALELMDILPFLLDFVKIPKKLPAGALRRLLYQERPAQPLTISVLPAMSYLCAMNNQMLDIIKSKA